MPTEGKSNQNQHGDHVDFHDDSHGCDAVVSERQKGAVRECYAETLHQVGDGSRDTDGEDLKQLGFVNIEPGRTDGKPFAASQ